MDDSSGAFMVLVDEYSPKADPKNLPKSVRVTRVAENLKEKVKKRWLEVFEQIGLIDEACEVVGITPGTILTWRREDDIFEKDFDYIRRFRLIHLLEDAAFRRAISGKSDLMLIAMLKNLKPEVYDEKTREKPSPPGIQISIVDIDGKILGEATSKPVDVIDVKK